GRVCLDVTSTPSSYALSLHDALPISAVRAELERLMSAEWDYDAIVQVWPAEAVERALEDAPWDEAPPDVHHYLVLVDDEEVRARDRKSTRLNSSHVKISYAVFCLKKK